MRFQGFLYNLTETERLAKAAKGTAPDTRGLGVQRSPPTPGQEVVVELPLALGLVSLGLWENFIDGEFRLMQLVRLNFLFIMHDSLVDWLVDQQFRVFVHVVVAFLSCPLVKKHADLLGSFLY